jgi:hypothetical protein
MRKILFLLTVLAISLSGNSQKLSPSVISSQGGFDKSEGFILEWTLGENFVETVSLHSQIYTQGFLQPVRKNILEKNQVQKPVFPYDITIYPNPVSSLLNVYVKAGQNPKLRIRMFDVTGKFIRPITFYLNSNHIAFDVSYLPSGIYIMKITDPVGPTIETFRIVKK